ncbi:MAG: HAMP domain-containing protein [Phycisphaerae bacterium]|nr:HAMP domain-containing protein [Phycisphaerae bacterium]
MRFTIGLKLALGFGTLAALSLASGLVSSWNLCTLRAKERYELENIVPSLIALNGISRGADVASRDPRNADGWPRIDETLKSLQTYSLEWAPDARADLTQLEAAIGAMRRATEPTTVIAAMDAVDGELEKLGTRFEAECRTAAAEAGSRTQTALWIIATFTLSGVAAAVTIGWGISRRIARNVKQLASRTTAIAEGDLTGKDLDTNGGDEFALLADASNQMCQRLRQIVGEVASGTRQIDLGAGHISSASQSIAEGAGRQAAAIEQISASIKQITSATRDSASSAVRASDLATESRKSATEGQTQVHEMVEAMGQIRESSSEIGKIIKLIDEIAFQTNLLALNAAVEAARAGEAGKGFAVVAEEVRSLAQRSAEAARSTSRIIEESSVRATRGSQLADRVAQSFDRITLSTAEVSGILAQIACSSEEQAKGVEAIAGGVGELNTVTQSSAANSEELAATAEETAAQVASLNQLVQHFRTTESGSKPSRPQGSAKARPSKAGMRKPMAATPSHDSFDEPGADSRDFSGF